MPRSKLKNKKRLVVKIGSSVLVQDGGKFLSHKCRALATEVAALHDQGRKVVIVSSGAIASAMGHLGRKKKPTKMATKQAFAAAGQVTLMHEYEKAFSKYGMKVAQVLLTREDLENHHRFLNARHTIQELLRLKLVPIINENDTVSVEEIKFGDNDNLSALVAHLVDADLLIGLSDVAGVFDSDPRKNPQAQRFSVIEHITPQLKHAAKGSSRAGSTGGMITKLQAAEKAQNFGIAAIIASGNEKKILQKILAGADVGTLVLPRGNK